MASNVVIQSWKMLQFTSYPKKTNNKFRKKFFHFLFFYFYFLILRWFSFNFFVRWHINLCRLFNAKSILVEEQCLYYFAHSQGFHAFSKGINQKVNVITWLGFELAYFEATDQHFSHYTMRTASLTFGTLLYIYIYIYI